MAGCFRMAWVLGVLVVCAAAAAAQVQQVPWDERPTLLVPRQAPSQKQLQQRESMKQYVLGLLCEKEDRIIEALQAYQEAARLDPEAAAVYKAQIPILAALDRAADALAAAQKVVALDPSDYESWYMLARLHKAKGALKEAAAALRSGLKTNVDKVHPEVGQQIHFELGSTLEALGQYKEAAHELMASAALLDHPDLIMEHGPFNRETILGRAAEVYERIGHLHRKTKQYEQAAAAYHKAQARVPAAAGRLNFNLAQVLEEQGKHEEALKHLDVYLRFQPQGQEAYELKITLLARLGRSEQIVPWLETASAADGFNVGLKLLLARQYVEARELTKGEKQYLELTEKSPSVDVYRGLFKLYGQNGPVGTTRIIDLLNRTLANSKEPGAAGEQTAAQARAMVAVLHEDARLAKDLLKLGIERIDRRQKDGLTFETVHFLAVLADRHRQPDEAERYYRRCLAQARPSNEALIYGGLLRVLWKTHKYEAILDVCRQGVKQASATNQILFHNDAARALARLERLPEALREIDQAIDLAGDNDRFAVKETRIRILAMAKKYREAEAECQEMLKEYKRPGELMQIRYILSSVYSASKQFAKAEEQLDWILRLDPNNATANNDLGYIWADQGKNLAQAEEMIRKALEMDRRQRKGVRFLTQEEDKDNPAYLDSLGWVLFRLGKLDEARKELEKASSHPDGEDPVIWDHLGDVYYRLHMYPEAQTAWRKALELLQRERRHRDDDRYRDLQRKLQIVKQQVRAP